MDELDRMLEKRLIPRIEGLDGLIRSLGKFIEDLDESEFLGDSADYNAQVTESILNPILAVLKTVKAAQS